MSEWRKLRKSLLFFPSSSPPAFSISGSLRRPLYRSKGVEGVRYQCEVAAKERERERKYCIITKILELIIIASRETRPEGIAINKEDA